MPLPLLGAAAVAALVAGAVRLRGLGRISTTQRQAVAAAEARVVDAVTALGGEVGDLSRLELGTGAAFLSTDRHLEVRFEIHGADPAGLYERLTTRLDLSPAVNGATSLGRMQGDVCLQLVPGETHLSVFLTGTG